MKPRYGYFSLIKSLSYVWQESRLYWSSQKKIRLKKDSSFSTAKIAKMNLSRKRALKQSEEYYLKFTKDPKDHSITHIRVCFEYFGDSLLGTESKMERTINNWILQFGVDPIKFQKSPIKEYEKFFIDAFDETHVSKKEEVFCPYCGLKSNTPLKYCSGCGSLLDFL